MRSEMVRVNTQFNAKWVGVGETAKGLSLDDWKIADVLHTGGRGVRGRAGL